MLSPEGVVDALELLGVVDISQTRDSITVATLADDTTYRVSFDFAGTVLDFEIDSGSGATATSILTALRNAINSNGIVASAADVTLESGPTLQIDSPVTGPTIYTLSNTANLSRVTTTFKDAGRKQDLVDTYTAIAGGERSVVIPPTTTQLDDYDFAGGSGDAYSISALWEIEVSAALDISGFEASPGAAAGPSFRLVHLANTGTANITLLEDDPASAPDNRIIGLSGAGFTLKPTFAVALIYDSNVSRWRVED